MIAGKEVYFISMCLQGFFYGFYSGIFVVYLQCLLPSKSRTGNVVFYALCLLYVLSTVAVVSDLLSLILRSRIRTLSFQLQIDSQPMLLRLSMVQIVAGSCCDFIGQCIMIYRCWIVWGKSIRVVIIPLFFAITYLATCLAATSTRMQLEVQAEGLSSATWEHPASITSFSLSMAVNALVTGLIVFRILKVFLDVKANSVGRTLASTGGTKLRHIIFIVIESGMALFAIQLVRVVLCILQTPSAPKAPSLNLVIRINEMFNGIAATIILVRVSMSMSFDDEDSFKEAAESLRFNDDPPIDPNTVQRMGSMPLPERNEDICFNNLPSNLNTLGSSSSSILSQKRSEDTPC